MTQIFPAELIIFTIDRTTSITRATLGIHVIATIRPYGEGLARYRIDLPGQQFTREVRTDQARRLVLHVLAEWFANAGPIFARVAETIAAQAELERRAA